MGEVEEGATGAGSMMGRIHKLDKSISECIYNMTRPIAPRPLLRFLELFADFRFFFPVTLALYIAAPSSSHLLRSLLLCSLLDLLFIAFLKFLVRRPRPSYANHDQYNALVSVDNFSFPSGHSSRVCFVASLFSLSHPPFTSHLLAPVWAWALLTLLSRLALARHYFFDVFFGACFGLLEAFLTFRLLQFQPGHHGAHQT